MKNEHLRTSRRQFLAQAGYFSGMAAAASFVPLRSLPEPLRQDTRISPTPVIDKGFAAVRQIGKGLYATISDTTKGMQTMCNGGFLVGADSALLLEGFVSAAGAAFQLETFRSTAKVPVQGALNTHYHFDHTMGNAVYGANGIPLWSHAATPKRIFDAYGGMQRTDKAAFAAQMQEIVANAKSDSAKKHAQEYAGFLSSIYGNVSSHVLGLPSHPIPADKLPLKVDLGGVIAVIETYAGHSGTDLIVRVPDQNVVYTGDLLFNGIFPVCFDEQATVSGWRNTLKTFASWDKDTIFVPGHGQLSGQKEIQQFRDEFDDISEQAEKLYKAGVPVSEAVERYVIPEKFKAVNVFVWNITIAPTIAKLYAEWGAK